jgi:hypothetical protein
MFPFPKCCTCLDFLCLFIFHRIAMWFLCVTMEDQSVGWTRQGACGHAGSLKPVLFHTSHHGKLVDAIMCDTRRGAAGGTGTLRFQRR